MAFAAGLVSWSSQGSYWTLNVHVWQVKHLLNRACGVWRGVGRVGWLSHPAHCLTWQLPPQRQVRLPTTSSCDSGLSAQLVGDSGLTLENSWSLS